MQHYAANDICECCPASLTGIYNYRNALPDADWADESVRRQVADVFNEVSLKDQEFPLWQISGAHNQNVFEDVMHDDLLGIRPHMVGGVLKELCDSGHFGTRDDVGGWISKLDEQLAEAFLRFCDYSNESGLSHSHGLFTHLQLTLTRTTDAPIIKAKAKNVEVISRWLAHEALQVQDTPYRRVRAMALQSFNDFYQLLSDTKCPNFRLTEAQAISLEEIRQKMLLGFHFLSKTNLESNVNIYRLPPKFHKMDELMRRSIRTRISPSLVWTFVLEHEMGIAGRLVGHLHAGPSSRRAVERWLIAFGADLVYREPEANAPLPLSL